MTRQEDTEFIALVPAGGSGARVGGVLAKQYLAVAGAPMIAHTVNNLLQMSWLSHVYVVVTAQDEQHALAAGLNSEHCTVLAVGGATRRDSVLAGLHAIQALRNGENPWVMVHDAARPGIPADLLERLRAVVLQQMAEQAKPDGVIAALRVADTVKRQIPPVSSMAEGGINQVAQTIDREGLWLAQTPQVFGLQPLIEALAQFPGATDEASAMERAGRSPWLEPGHWHNMKVTAKEDLIMIGAVLAQRESSRGESAEAISSQEPS